MTTTAVTDGMSAHNMVYCMCERYSNHVLDVLRSARDVQCDSVETQCHHADARRRRVQETDEDEHSSIKRVALAGAVESNQILMNRGVAHLLLLHFYSAYIVARLSGGDCRSSVNDGVTVCSRYQHSMMSASLASCYNVHCDG